MTSAEVHDAAARQGVDAARWACWAEPDWEGGVADHLGRLRPLRYLPPGSAVLDVGCGVGRLVVPLAVESPAVSWVGYDPSPAMLGHAADAAIAANATVTLTDRWDAIGPVDAAYSMLVLQHLPAAEQEATVAALGALVRPGGVVVLQWQENGDRGPLSHPVPMHQFVGWLRAAGFEAESAITGAGSPTWAWTEARRKP